MKIKFSLLTAITVFGVTPLVLTQSSFAQDVYGDPQAQPNLSTNERDSSSNGFLQGFDILHRAQLIGRPGYVFNEGLNNNVTSAADKFRQAQLQRLNSPTQAVPTNGTIAPSTPTDPIPTGK